MSEDQYPPSASSDLAKARSLYASNWQRREARTGDGASALGAEAYWCLVALPEILECANDGFRLTWFTQLGPELVAELARIARGKGFEAVIDRDGDLCIAWVPEGTPGGT